MVTTFNKKDLVKFGKYLLSEKREESLKQISIENPTALPYEEISREVYHADFENWKEKQERENIEKHILDDMNSMCVSSLDPEAFENWELIKIQLKNNRRALK
jgi:hypothetical protein